MADRGGLDRRLAQGNGLVQVSRVTGRFEPQSQCLANLGLVHRLVDVAKRQRRQGLAESGDGVIQFPAISRADLADAGEQRAAEAE